MSKTEIFHNGTTCVGVVFALNSKLDFLEINFVVN